MSAGWIAFFATFGILDTIAWAWAIRKIRKQRAYLEGARKDYIALGLDLHAEMRRNVDLVTKGAGKRW